MKILINGSERNFLDCRKVLSDVHELLPIKTRDEVASKSGGADLVIDFAPESDKGPYSVYAHSQIPVLLNTVLTTLRKRVEECGLNHRPAMYGFNGLPGFLSSPCLEVTVRSNEEAPALKNLLETLGVDHVLVEDQVGMVAPRVVCMIINEAYLAVEENTARREDIDQAMKLGTNYPFGPFEWCERIGVVHVFKLLEAVLQTTGDERYRVSPLLRAEQPRH